ncbi:MAG: uroporphyrinogen decarboxylase family protein [Pelolinea sp.]|nr:uroporphyrinogen decarboxylase family protein [Pelolinea sp.]
MAMNSRERVIKAINHQEPDRVPLDLNPLNDFYLNLKQYLHLEIEEQVKHNFAMEVVPHPLVLEKLGIDITSVKLGSPKVKKKEPRSDGYIEDEWGVVYRVVAQPGGGSYCEVVKPPLKDAKLSDLVDYPWPVPDLPGRGEEAEKNAKALYEDTEFAILGRFGGPITETALYMLGMENWMIRLASEPEFMEALLGKITDIQIALDRIGLEATAKYLQIFKASGEDLGMQTGPLYSMKMFRNQLLPHLKRRFQAARKYLDSVNPSVKIMLHSCGSISRFIPDLIEAGIDIIDPIQPRAAEMNSADLKAKFGDRISFHGGIDIQQVLPFGTKEEIEEEVKNRINSLGPGGGYILAPAHNVQADVKPENIIYMIEAAKKFGIYPHAG